MKKMIFGLALIATCVASAETTVTSANTFGVLKITSSDEETVICVPWVKVGDGGAIDAESLVLTSNLKVGDQLYACVGGMYYTWTLKQDTDSETGEPTGPKYWGTSLENDNGKTSLASNSLLPRGTGLILIRKNSNGWDDTSRNTAPIYLYGQYTSTGGKTSTVAGATEATAEVESKAVFTLIAPPSTESVQLNSATMDGAAEGDMIITATGTAYTFMYPVNNYVQDTSKYKWCRPVMDETTKIVNYVADENVAIPAGRGAWYMRKKGETEGFTITWWN